MNQELTILVADDHPLVRSGVKAVLEQNYEATILEANDGKEAQELIEKHKPDLAVLDINMPEKTGLQVIEATIAAHPDTKYIVLTMHKEESFFNKAFDVGVAGYLLKETALNEILSCIEMVLEGNQYASKNINELLKSRQELLAGREEVIQMLDTLTNSERKTLELIADSKSSKEIADLLFVTPKSVDNYRSRICKKLDLKPEKTPCCIGFWNINPIYSHFILRG